MPASPSALPTPPTRFVDRQLRPDADRAFRLGMDLLAGVDLALQAHLAHDTAGSAQILTDMIEAAVAPILKAGRLYGQRAGAR